MRLKLAACRGWRQVILSIVFDQTRVGFKRYSAFDCTSLWLTPSPSTAHAETAGAAGPQLGMLKLAALTFFAVSGGPFGVEPLVRTGGPGWTALGVLGVPYVWGLPMAMMTAELSTALPDSGGYIVWIHRAFGDFWATQARCAIANRLQSSMVWYRGSCVISVDTRSLNIYLMRCETAYGRSATRFWTIQCIRSCSSTISWPFDATSLIRPMQMELAMTKARYRVAVYCS